MDMRSVHLIEWLGRSGMLSSLTTLNMGQMMIMDTRMLAAVKLAIKAAAGAIEIITLALCHEIEFSKRTSYCSSTPYHRTLI